MVFFYITEFFAGLSVMAVELSASRFLAPYFSSSQIVWTIIIAAIMAAMALGNFFGGRSADRDPDPAKLYLRILAASVWIAAIPAVGKYIVVGITGLLIITVDHNFLIIAALLACLVIFVFPCFLLGTCTPSLIRYTVSGAEDSGRTAGRLGALNTLGSIIGTFLPTFVTIPAVGTAVTFYMTAGVLFVLSVRYFVSRPGARRGKGDADMSGAGRTSPGETGSGKGIALRFALAGAAFATAVALGCGSGFAFWQDDLLYEGESVYNYLQVYDAGDSIALSTNVLFGVQSVAMKEPGLTGMYYDHALAAPVMAAAEDCDILILGMGTGTYAGQCERYFEGAVIKGVEIDPKITKLAGEYFGASPDIPVITYDGRAYLDADRELHDVIFVDAYQDITIPFQMSSVEFFSSVRDHLAPGGIMVVNLNMRTPDKNGISAALGDTIASVFSSVYSMDVGNGSTNRLIFASRDDAGPERLMSELPEVRDGELRAMLEKTAASMRKVEVKGPALTDDKAPVELLGMRAIDGIIGQELHFYKEIYKQRGISGLLDMF